MKAFEDYLRKICEENGFDNCSVSHFTPKIPHTGFSAYVQWDWGKDSHSCASGSGVTMEEAFDQAIADANIRRAEPENADQN